MLQRPPIMPLFRGLRSVFDGGDDEEHTFGAIIEALTSSRPPTSALASAAESYRALCTLGVFSWDAVMAHGPRRMLWSSQFCESSLDQWVHAHDSIPSPGFMLLYHALHINMLVCWPTVQNVVVAYLDDIGRLHPNSDRPRRSASAKRQFERSSLESIFAHSQDRPKARWHAGQILQQARFGQVSGIGARNDAADNPATPPPEERNGWEHSEPPHFSFCVCLATLVLWCDEMLVADNNEHATKRWLEAGLGILKNDPEASCGIKSLFGSIIHDLLTYAG
ncbi:hypothetical protein BJ170DRAFT_224515 [Xylariales sp. AK1849]|nr:hypothetical protein BJ170DRAFT_224515 [Xylariales sp. AK1849]